MGKHLPRSESAVTLRPVTLSLVPQKPTTAARFAAYTSLGLLLPVATFVGYLIGHYLDKAFGTTWLQILFLILGSVAGFVALIRQIMRDSSDDGA